MPPESAKASVKSQTSHPASAAPRRLPCHAMTATEGMTRATMSEATPTAVKSTPATSLAPSDLAYQAFMQMPTAARASAAAMRIIQAADRRDDRDAVTGANVTVGGGSGVTVPVGSILEIAPSWSA